MGKLEVELQCGKNRVILGDLGFYEEEETENSLRMVDEEDGNRHWGVAGFYTWRCDGVIGCLASGCL